MYLRYEEKQESTYLVLLASAHGTRQSNSWYARHS